ncbi:MAG: threonine/serine exporter family protein [Limosilactobacillus gorillae]|uniref:threonine/serine exporter family protein n=1 Tax=Limosilactobacillus gorillae TaxID=1450649 RepID=UPI000B0E6D86|nr:threonine/serine exporter family protein [Limosilactobacillus gorillae]MDO4855138.1 threonine/serine exporter family protein [Limosilactobacillus gorillae]
MTQEEMNLAVSTCLLAGQILIENGSNMERVNDTMYRIAANAGLKSFQAFTTVTGVVASSDHCANAQVVDVRIRRNDLTRIAQVNAISRDFADHKIELKEAYQRLSMVDQTSTKQPVLLQCLAAAIMSFTLMIVFTGDTQDTLAAFLVGGSSYWVYLWLVSTFRVRYLGEFCTALMIGALASTVVHFGLAQRVDDIIIGSIMSLVPGVPITNAARDIVSGNGISGITRMLEALLTAAAIGCAIVLVLRYL